MMSVYIVKEYSVHYDCRTIIDKVFFSKKKANEYMEKLIEDYVPETEDDYAESHYEIERKYIEDLYN